MSETEAAALEAHVESCEQCLEAVRSLRTDDPLLEAVRAGVRQDALSGEHVAEGLFTLLCGLPDSAATSVRATTPNPQTEEARALLAPAQEPDELGRFGAYGVLRVLGSGGMGIVFAARQSRPRRIVALKMILAGPEARREMLARFRAEADAIARLQHPNIVAVYEVGEQNNRPYFTLEYVAGGSLAQKLTTAPLTAADAAPLVETLARAVHFAHEQGVIHRDLKPANVLLTEDGSPKLTDFGLSKVFSRESADETGRTQSGVILGTPGYMAPEQALGGSGHTIGPAADVYALGAILYECLTGRPPFKAATVLETLEQVRWQEPVPPRVLQPTTPFDLQIICLQCLQKEPDRRYPSAAALADDLGRFVRGEPIRARPTPTLVRLIRWTRRRPTLAALTAFSGLLLLVVIVGGTIDQLRLRAALATADANAEEMRRQRERADRDYRTARNTLNRMTGRVQNHGLGEIPRLKELQRQLLEEALGFYQTVFRGADDLDPMVRLDTAVAYQQAGAIQQMLGRPADAMGNYHRALALLDGLPTESRTSPSALKTRVGLCNALGILARLAQKFEEAEQHHRAGIVAAEQLLDVVPNDLRAVDALAESHHDLGDVYQNQRKTPEAEASYRRAIEIRTQVLRDQPNSETQRVALAEDQINLALLYQTSNRSAEAKQAYTEAETLLRPLVDRPTRNGDHALSLAAMNINWSYLLRAEDKSQAARQRLDEAVQLTEAVLAQEPQHAGARFQTYNAHGARAQFHESLEQYTEAVRDWDRVVELDPGSQKWLNRVLRAATLARAGDHVRATSEAKALAADPAVIPDGRYNLACAYALSIEAVTADDRLPAEERERLAEQYAAASIALLKKLAEDGYFDDVQHARTLKEDSDLDPLRERDEFLRLGPK